MAEPTENKQSDFMIEKIKERPVNKRKLIRRTMITAAMAVIFGSIACVTFLVLEPVLNKWLYPEEKPAPIVFPEDVEEMAPEEMLSDSSTEVAQEGEISSLDPEQMRQIMSNIVLNRDNYKQMYSDLSYFVRELNHSMVTVTGMSSDIDWFNDVEERRNQSSGVVIANNGKSLLVLADYAPLKRAQSLSLTFTYLDGTTGGTVSVPATFQDHDPMTDLAIFSVELSDVPEEILGTENGIQVAPLGTSNLRNIVGTPVIALGSPMGSSGSVGYGMISSVSVQNQKADANYKFLQTDIYGSQNAGGILFNMQGQVIGIISNQKPGNDMKNMVTAIGISEIKKSIEKMSNSEKIAYLGINGTDVTEEAHASLGVPYGAYVRDIEMNSPSMRAGIQQGDVLVNFGESILHNYNDYVTALLQAEAGSAVDLKIMRPAMGNYKEMTVRVTLGER
ncbi:MAG: trypsin-like peptidase domain-containing protein [Lachnospiraceae bacterium]|nr:trypsin-like peptidase domain-containing protein [Lachnospiraceae bacterium]